MEHALVELAPGRQREMPVVGAAQPDQDRAGRRSRSVWRPARAGQQPGRHRRQAVRQRAEMRQFESELARWVR
jgi:hypothetical protein